MIPNTTEKSQKSTIFCEHENFSLIIDRENALEYKITFKNTSKVL